ncbi:hypothetical protein [Solobacterium moorei]|uniref:hypothetical protein n=1 Tax=Solobacterium moorei TaxID=102148 RepID=UPI000414E2D8|nr:hypothetical protein [Solobacterium moorei]BET22309.1 hypothetical protein RGT18_18970 [Solobacterium moorei]
MKAFINKITGTLMYVDDSRVDEYIEAGYEPASDTNEDETVSEVEKNTDTDETEEDSKKIDKKSGKKGA